MANSCDDIKGPFTRHLEKLGEVSKKGRIVRNATKKIDSEWSAAEEEIENEYAIPLKEEIDMVKRSAGKFVLLDRLPKVFPGGFTGRIFALTRPGAVPTSAKNDTYSMRQAPPENFDLEYALIEKTKKTLRELKSRRFMTWKRKKTFKRRLINLGKHFVIALIVLAAIVLMVFAVVLLLVMAL